MGVCEDSVLLVIAIVVAVCYLTIRLSVVSVWFDDVIRIVFEQECSMTVLKMALLFSHRHRECQPTAEALPCHDYFC